MFLIGEEFLHEVQDLSEDEVFVDKEKEEAFENRVVVHELVNGLRGEYLVSVVLEEHGFFESLLIEVSHFPSHIYVQLFLLKHVLQVNK